jgi:ferredoxin
LAYILEWDLRHRRKRSAQARPLPILTQPEKCTLCGFCVQVCPTRAILIQETNDITALVVNDTACINCQQCSHTCPTGVLHLEKSLPDPSRRVIRQSLRAHCPACGQPTVSHAELETIAALIGEPAWLKYCLSCRTMGLEKTI